MRLDTVSFTRKKKRKKFLSSKHTHIVKGHRINLVFICIFITLALVQRYLLRRANELKQAEKAKLTQEELQQLAENDDRIGDESLDYVYRL